MSLTFKALVLFLPEGCCGQQLYFSIYANLLMQLHPCGTGSVAVSTQLNPNPNSSVVPAGWLHCSSLPGQTSGVRIHPWARVTKASCKWGIVTAGEEKKCHHACWCIAFYGRACHILLLIYEHAHHIASTKQDIFTSPYPT